MGDLCKQRSGRRDIYSHGKRVGNQMIDNRVLETVPKKVDMLLVHSSGDKDRQSYT